MEDPLQVLASADGASSTPSRTCASSCSSQQKEPIDGSQADAQSILWSSLQNSQDDACDTMQSTPRECSQNYRGSFLSQRWISSVFASMSDLLPWPFGRHVLDSDDASGVGCRRAWTY